MNKETEVAIESTACEDGCAWNQDIDGFWATDCGNYFMLEEGLPSHNNMSFCCYCGKKLKEAEFQEVAD